MKLVNRPERSTADAIVPGIVNMSHCTFSVLVVCDCMFFHLAKYLNAQVLHRFSEPPAEHNYSYVGRRVLVKIPERYSKYIGQFWPFFTALLGSLPWGLLIFFLNRSLH
jgi:hypothetical protein